MKIGIKLILTMGIVIVVAIAAISVIIGFSMTNEARSQAEVIATETALHHANAVKAAMEVAMDEARALGDVFQASATEDGFRLTRRKANILLKSFIEDNPNFLGVYVAFEPDAFDGADKNFVNEWGHDSTGRFIPYWTLDGEGKGVLEPLIDYEVAGAGDYYQLPKKRKQETIIDPYWYPIQGVDVLITSLVVPILDDDNRFLGIAGLDLTLDSLQDLVKNVTIYDTGYLNFMSANGDVVASKSEDFIGKNISEVTDVQEYIAGVASGEPFLFTNTSAVTGKTTLVSGVPAEIGYSDISWIVTANITEDEILAGSRRLLLLIILTGAAAVIIALVVLFILSRSIVKPLTNAVTVTKIIAKGDLTGTIDTSGKDEVGVLLGSMKDMKDSLTGIVTDIKSAAVQVNSGSQQMSSTSQQLSQGASEQASSIEEISSSMEEMVSNINQNADNAQETEKIAQKASSDAEESGNAVLEAVQAMKQIAEKINIVEEIARQTNMLSLNASIEAARAGEHGKGFAVVASEVGKLAARSKDAASEISELSSSTIQVAEKAQEMLEHLVPDIKQTADLVQEISAASREQSAGADQVGSAINQLDEVIQQAAAAAEEMSSISEEFASQAEEMQSTMQFFQLDNESPQTGRGSTGPVKRLPAQQTRQESEETGLTTVEEETPKAAMDKAALDSDNFDEF